MLNQRPRVQTTCFSVSDALRSVSGQQEDLKLHAINKMKNPIIVHVYDIKSYLHTIVSLIHNLHVTNNVIYK